VWRTSHVLSMIQRKADVIWKEVDGKAVGLDLGSSRYFSLNPTGVTLWELLESPTDESSLAEALVREHKINDEQARSDVSAFVASLRQNQLIEE
jgi:hypothetical protein